MGKNGVIGDIETAQQNARLKDFIDYTLSLKGDEKGEAPLFCDRLFRAFGHEGIKEAHGTLEARIKFSEGGTKFADCLWSPPGRAGVLIEMKKRSEVNLEKHFPQARDYWVEMNPEIVIGPGAQKPKYIILCNFDRFIIYNNLTRVDDINLKDLIDRQTALNFLRFNERNPVFKNNVEEISKDVAKTIGELYKYLIFDKKENQQKSRVFILQCVLSLFSEDFGLLPHGFFTGLIEDCRAGKDSSYDLLGGLFRQMASSSPAAGGKYKGIPYFNGGLFETVEPIELDTYALNLLSKAGAQNWKNINPAIFGSLFEGTMNAKERHAFGAHFTSEADILKIVNPTIIRPWRAHIDKANTLTELTQLLTDLEKFKVLDPACGCGNFLFVAYRVIKDIEMQIIEKIANNFTKTSKLNLGISRVKTSQFYGIDIQPTAVEVAKMTMMLAKELSADAWNSRIGPLLSTLGLGYEQGLPLENLDNNILCRDALLEDWPAFDVVIGNPPYQSKNKMKQEMDNAYIENIRQKYSDVPGRADFCVYWFRKAHELMKPGQRAGLVGTNTIRQNDSRVGGLDYITANGGTITDAVSTQVWSGDAAVHVSIVNWVKGQDNGPRLLVFQNGNDLDSPFEYTEPKTINSSLSNTVDVSSAKALMTNSRSGCCYQGQTHGHEGFLLETEKAQEIIAKDQKYKNVLFPFLIGDQLLGELGSKPKRYVIDFSKQDIFQAQKYPVVFSIIKSSVFVDREGKAKEEEKKNKVTLEKNPKAKVNKDHSNAFKSWWTLFRQRNELMGKIDNSSRYIACSRVTKRPIFEFISSKIHPNDALQVFPLDDDYSFGILQSSIHWAWFNAKCSTLEERPRYTSDTVFDSFPWPQKPSQADVQAVATLVKELRDKRREIMKRDGLTLRALYRVMESTPNNPVSVIQEKLDKAVMAAYKMGKSIEVLSFLLKLNHSLADAEMKGTPIVGPGLPSFVTDRPSFVSMDCVDI